MPDVDAETVTVAGTGTETPAPICFCGATTKHSTADDRCARGHVLAGNATARKHGAYAYENRGPAALPADLRMSVEEFRHGIIRDKGGPDNLTTLQAGAISNITDIEVVKRLYVAEITRRGAFTERGRERSIVRGLREQQTLWLKYAVHIGDERAQNTLSLTQRLASAPLTTEGRDVGE